MKYQTIKTDNNFITIAIVDKNERFIPICSTSTEEEAKEHIEAYEKGTTVLAEQIKKQNEKAIKTQNEMFAKAEKEATT